MIEKTYRVSGMSCAHCAEKVRSAISVLPGVGEVGVDVDRGKVTVHSEAIVPADDLRTAVEQAGYRVTGG